MNLLPDGVDVEMQDLKHGWQSRKARLVDFDNPGNNDFLAVNQFVVIEEREHRRFDLVAFINGMPLAVFELKGATNANATLRHAFNQIQTYRNALPLFFRFNLANVISDSIEARIGSLTAGFDRYAPWRTGDGATLADLGTAEIETLIRGVFDRNRFLDIAIHQTSSRRLLIW